MNLRPWRSTPSLSRALRKYRAESADLIRLVIGALHSCHAVILLEQGICFRTRKDLLNVIKGLSAAALLDDPADDLGALAAIGYDNSVHQSAPLGFILFQGLDGITDGGQLFGDDSSIHQRLTDTVAAAGIHGVRCIAEQRNSAKRPLRQGIVIYKREQVNFPGIANHCADVE